MDLLEAIENRHSVRAYKVQPIEEEKRQELNAFIAQCNADSGLCIKAVYDDPEGFDSKLAQYGSFKNVQNYIVLAGKKNDDIDEKCGYYGEKIVLQAQTMGLNTCWAAMTFNKAKVKTLLNSDEKLCMVIAFGYGETEGNPHKGKGIEDVVASKGTMPDWFEAGAKAALLAPTAVNQQKFKLGIKDGEAVAVVSGLGFHTKVDLGIVKYHFEIGSGRRIK